MSPRKLNTSNEFLINMNDILKSFKKMRMNNKIKTTTTNSQTLSTHFKAHNSSCLNPTSSFSPPMDQPTKDLKKILKLLKKHVKKQIILKKPKILI